jgi:hypothetical protein
MWVMNSLQQHQLPQTGAHLTGTSIERERCFVTFHKVPSRVMLNHEPNLLRPVVAASKHRPAKLNPT